MTETPDDDKPGFVAEEPVHCYACFRLIRPGQTYYLTIEHVVLCANCALDEGVIRVREDLAATDPAFPDPPSSGTFEFANTSDRIILRDSGATLLLQTVRGPPVMT
jgi:hypothetical protein